MFSSRKVKSCLSEVNSNSRVKRIAVLGFTRFLDSEIKGEEKVELNLSFFLAVKHFGTLK